MDSPALKLVAIRYTNEVTKEKVELQSKSPDSRKGAKN